MATKKVRTITPVFRAGFVSVFDKDDNDNYSVVCLFDKGEDLKTCPKNKVGYKHSLKQLVALAAKEKWGDKLPKGLKLPFHDQGEKDYDGYVDGAIFVNAKSKKMKPVVVDRNRQEIDPNDPEGFYSGCYAQAIVTAYAWEHPQGGKGVNIGLSGIQKVKDGEHLAGSMIDPENDFEEMDDLDEMANSLDAEEVEELGDLDDLLG